MEAVLQEVTPSNTPGSGYPILEVAAISKSYGRLIALSDMTLTVEPGEIHGLLGPNGSGKTTALHSLAGIVRTDGGHIQICGRDISLKSSRAFLGFAPDDLSLPSMLTGDEYLRLHDRLRNRSDRPTSAPLLTAFGIQDAVHRKISEYSHGMRRKLQVVAAVMHQPRLLLLDEPFRGLDPQGMTLLREIILKQSERGGAVLIATHDMLRAQRDCHKVTILSESRTVATGSPAQILQGCAADDLEEAFLSLTASGEARSSALYQIDEYYANLG